LTVEAGRRRRTLAAPTELFQGIGLHSGKPATVRFLPAPSRVGRIFRNPETRQDIPAHIKNLAESERCTILASQHWRLSTVEHVLSALAGLDLDDVIIEVTGEELPIGDGSAAPFVALLDASGVAESDDLVLPLKPLAPCIVTGEKGECIVCRPASDFRITVILDYPNHPFIGTQVLETSLHSASYRSDVAPARTYGFLAELDWLHTHGLGLGASRDNVVVLKDDGYDSDLRYSDELVRHKMLDLVGDLALVGRPIEAHIYAIKPSHRLNTKLASLLTLDEYN